MHMENFHCCAEKCSSFTHSHSHVIVRTFACIFSKAKSKSLAYTSDGRSINETNRRRPIQTRFQDSEPR